MHSPRSQSTSSTSLVINHLFIDPIAFGMNRRIITHSKRRDCNLCFCAFDASTNFILRHSTAMRRKDSEYGCWCTLLNFSILSFWTCEAEWMTTTCVWAIWRNSICIYSIVWVFLYRIRYSIDIHSPSGFFVVAELYSHFEIEKIMQECVELVASLCAMEINWMVSLLFCYFQFLE